MEGMAKSTRIRAGRVVQIVSICWASKILRAENLLVRRLNVAHPTTVIMRMRIVMAWS